MSYRREPGPPLVPLGVPKCRHQINSVTCHYKYSGVGVGSHTVSCSLVASRRFSVFHIPSRSVTQPPALAELMQSCTVSPLKRWRVVSSSVYATNWNRALNEGSSHQSRDLKIRLLTHSSAGSIASENFAKLIQSKSVPVLCSSPGSIFLKWVLMWVLIASQMSRARFTSTWDTCAWRLKDTASRPTTSSKNLMTSVAG